MEHPSPQILPSDIVIAVMGVTGSGKSKFINHIAEQDVPVGHNLTSCTNAVEVYSFVYKHNRRIFLVDTPGFDDTNRTDTQILKDIAYFLSSTYQQNILLSGIIYLHRITDQRMSGSSVRNLNMFKKLCGENAYQHVVLVTNMWGNLEGKDLSFDDGVRREQQLLDRKDWWGLMYQRGSRVYRHTDDKQSALNIVHSIISVAQPVLLTIQKEMVDEAKSLENTDAGLEYGKELRELQRLHKEQVKELKEEYEQALKYRDLEQAALLREQRQELDKRLNETSRAQESLKVTLDQLQKEKLDQFKELSTKIENEQRKTAKLVSEREADLRRFEDEQRQIRHSQHEAQLKFEHEKTSLQNYIDELTRRSESAAAEQQRVHLRQLEDLQAELEKQRISDAQAAKAAQAALQHQIDEAKKAETKLGSIMQFAAGAATTIAGGIMAEPVFVLGGLSTMANAMN